GGDAVDQGAAAAGIDDRLAIVAGEGLDADILRDRGERLVALVLQIADRLAERVGAGDLLVQRLHLLQAGIDRRDRGRDLAVGLAAHALGRGLDAVQRLGGLARGVGGRLLQAGVGRADRKRIERILE